MKIKIEELTRALKKSTIGYMFDYCQLIVSKDRVKAGLINETKSVIVKLDLENNFIQDLDNEIEFNLADPGQNVIPFLQIFPENDVDVEFDLIRDNIVKTMKLKDKKSKISTKINFSEPMSKRLFNKQPNIDKYQLHTAINSEFYEKYNAIKKIANRTNKIYLTLEDNQFYIEAGDKFIQFINSVKIELSESDQKMDNFFVCFDFKNWSSIMSVFDIDKDYTFKLAYSKDKKMGFVYFNSDDLSEQYFLSSITS